LVRLLRIHIVGRLSDETIWGDNDDFSDGPTFHSLQQLRTFLSGQVFKHIQGDHSIKRDRTKV
jgi:hypothetical protein